MKSASKFVLLFYQTIIKSFLLTKLQSMAYRPGAERSQAEDVYCREIDLGAFRAESVFYQYVAFCEFCSGVWNSM